MATIWIPAHDVYRRPVDRRRVLVAIWDSQGYYLHEAIYRSEGPYWRDASGGGDYSGFSVFEGVKYWCERPEDPPQPTPSTQTCRKGGVEAPRPGPEISVDWREVLDESRPEYAELRGHLRKWLDESFCQALQNGLPGLTKGGRDGS